MSLEQRNDYLHHVYNLRSWYLNYQKKKYFDICLLLDSNYLKFLGKGDTSMFWGISGIFSLLGNFCYKIKLFI